MVVFDLTCGILEKLGFYNKQSIFLYVSLISQIFKYFSGEDETNYMLEYKVCFLEPCLLRDKQGTNITLLSQALPIPIICGIKLTLNSPISPELARDYFHTLWKKGSHGLYLLQSTGESRTLFKKFFKSSKFQQEDLQRIWDISNTQ